MIVRYISADPAGNLTAIVLSPVAPPSRAAVAARMMARCPEGFEQVGFAEEDSLPVWAKVAVYSMYALGIFEKGDTPLDPAEKVTRADAAGYLLF